MCGDTTNYSHNLRCVQCRSSWFDIFYYLEDALDVKTKLLNSRRQSMWRYAHLLPLLDQANIVTLEEGWTPILELRGYADRLGLGRILAKDERRNPTGSFKDRQASLAVSVLKEQRITELVVSSAGNAGVAYAAYCAKAGITLTVFLPQNANEASLREITAYGARAIKTVVNYDETKTEAREFARQHGIHYDLGGVECHNRESMKTVAYEIAEQMNWAVPDWYVQAVSGCLGPLGVWKGFSELHSFGLIDRIPKIACVQVDGCSPMVEAFQMDLPVAKPVYPATDIPALSTGDPGFAYTLLRHRLLDTGGTVLSVSVSDVNHVITTLAVTEGMLMSPAAAVAFAGVRQLILDNHLFKDEIVVVNCSGGNNR